MTWKGRKTLLRRRVVLVSVWMLEPLTLFSMFSLPFDSPWDRIFFFQLVMRHHFNIMNPAFSFSLLWCLCLICFCTISQCWKYKFYKHYWKYSNDSATTFTSTRIWQGCFYSVNYEDYVIFLEMISFINQENEPCTIWSMELCAFVGLQCLLLAHLNKIQVFYLYCYFHII